MDKNTKNINIAIHYETWKKIKIISIDRDVPFQDVVREILEKYVNRKNKQDITEE